mmetsp:Transcript_15751/g.32556  ORF Transcript_15751/g.32556 Transcript_15751/m.32556 type:complete len:365 (-) Transcript_15751:90-1184(-)
MICSGATSVVCQGGRNHVEGMGSSASSTRWNERFLQITNLGSTTESTKLTLDVIKSNNRRKKLLDSVSGSGSRNRHTAGVAVWLRSLSDGLHQNGLRIQCLGVLVVFQLVRKGNLELVGVHSRRIQGMWETIRELADGREGKLHRVVSGSRAGAHGPRVAHANHFALEHIGLLVEFVRLLPAGHLRRQGASLQHGHDLVVDHGFVRHGQIQWGHTIVVLQMQGIRVGINEQLDNLGSRTVGGSHVQRQTSVLVADGCSLGVANQQDLDGLDGCLPHTGLVDGKVSHTVGLGGTSGVGPQQDLDDIGRGLETTGGVQGEVSAVVQARGLLGKGGLLATAQESAKALAKVMQLSVRHVDIPMPMLL